MAPPTPPAPLTSPAALIALALAGLAALLPPPQWGAGQERAAAGVTIDTLPRLVYTAHRGGALESPENSMSGLTAAYRGGAASVLDVDVRMLRDGTLVAMHDSTLDRTTFSRGPVRELDARQWREVRLRGTRPAERPPTLAEVLDRFGGRVVLMLEAKDPRSLERLAAMVHGRGLTASVLVNSRHPEVARAAHALGLRAQLWRSARQLRTDDPSRWRTYVDVLDVDHRARDEDLRRAVRSGIARVWAHTVNTEQDRDRALRLGCDGIITDAPRRLTGAGGRARG
ncbi:glycerophosphodiester phosphodiesterase [Streptomyces purpureus]|uniref:Glycerophosphoryl diester phosphodiesterase n=1 Tax=Streptomyces purpureus TaxID=1951 RepID=A0A918H0H1_9ACTN|nr:glycerophosphodiester phosphodiesterase [Streptomyces purpureus]GGT25938.1 glycerophosphoryl diester phosphodiesterase [Streptomyces purpureus]